MEELIQEILDKGLSMVDGDRFNTILRNFDNINKLEGDIIECGCWKGGMSIFLGKLFEEKNVWVLDSFEGFQPLDYATYQYHDEPHHPGYDSSIKANHLEVINNFKHYGLESPRVQILKGFVKDTLSDVNTDKIALLRIDVDAYSATREILDHLYPKVVKGGYIIFDDSCLIQTVDAFCDYFEEKNIEFDLLDPREDCSIPNKRLSNHPCGCYIIKK
jgi:O-methyltransferase